MTVIQNKITPKEWKQYVIQQMYRRGFTRKERDLVNMVFASDLRDAEPGEVASFFDRVRPGISEQEVQDMISTLRDKNSPASRSARLQLQPEK